MTKPLLVALALAVAAVAAAILVPWDARTAEAHRATPVVGHRIDARLAPDSGRIEAEDRLELPRGRTRWELLLHSGLDPKVTTGNAELRSLGADGQLERWRLSLTAPGPVAIAYAGVIRHDFDPIREGMGRRRQVTAGTIGPEGVFLDASGGWYPRVPGSLQRFDLRVALPEGWQALSQGRGPGADTGWSATWSEHQPQDDIYLVAAPFKLYRSEDPSSGVEAQVWLRRPDPELAERYLAATHRYIALYRDLVGAYPYAKFALVENFWETGYGMPSFTLLGARVIRLPFIIHTSYPHEILHNWWGNGVYVDYAHGNWSEGLTAYLADHLIKETAGRGAEYRRDTLKSYADHVREGKDFPVAAFRGRHGSASQAIGYGKTAMIFHMTRRMLGDEAFKRGLRHFYADNRFQVAGWPEVRAAFERAGGRDLGAFFDAWVRRTGAPRLAIDTLAVDEVDGSWRLSGRIAQTQSEAPFPLLVPVLVQGADGSLEVEEVFVDSRSVGFELELPSPPVRVAVDPAFDTFRALVPGESPVSLSNLFGSPTGTIVLPGGAEPGLLAAYRELAGAWIEGHPGWRIVLDTGQQTLPDAGAVWILGWENRLAAQIVGSGFSLDPAAGRLTLAGERYEKRDASPVLTAGDAARPLGWLAASDAAAVPGLARKLPHYGRYGYLAFTGAAPDNIAKGQWPPGDSELVRWLVPEHPAPVAWDRPALIEPARQSR